MIAAQWRAAAASRGLGELHLCAAESSPGVRPEDIGFDSFLENPPSAGDPADVVAAALARPWPPHRFFRAVQCRRDSDLRAGELYEHWLRSVFDATRVHGEKLVFIDSWNDWLRGFYLEPDDRDGRAALLATRRAVRGPASGLVLLRRLRDALGEVGRDGAAVLNELGQVLALHEHTRDRLLASVEVALGRTVEPAPDTPWSVPVNSAHLPASGGRFSLDVVGDVGRGELQGAQEPISLQGDEVRLAGWAHIEDGMPGEVDLLLAFEIPEPPGGTANRVFRVMQRVARPDVALGYPGYPEDCGFDTVIKLTDLPPGDYRVAIVQRTSQGAYRDATGVTVRRTGAP
jgi:hypothetical protein